MRYYLICDDRDTMTGMRLAGIMGEMARDKKEAEALISAAAADENVAVLIVTEGVAAMCPEKVSEIRLSESRPLVTIVPDRSGTGREKDSITRLINDAIGVRL